MELVPNVGTCFIRLILFLTLKDVWNLFIQHPLGWKLFYDLLFAKLHSLIAKSKFLIIGHDYCVDANQIKLLVLWEAFPMSGQSVSKIHFQT